MDLKNELSANAARKLDPNKDKVFTANGVKYFVEEGMSIARYAEFQMLEKELGYGVTFEVLFDKLKTIFKNLEKTNFATCAVLMNDILQGVAKLPQRRNPVLKICALFINTDDENRAVIDKDTMEKKIKDWEAEGLDISFFFSLAVGSVSGFLEIYNNIIQSITPLEPFREEAKG